MNLKINMVKLTVYIYRNFFELFEKSNRQIENEIIRHCCNEKRKDRKNITQIYQSENP